MDSASRIIELSTWANFAANLTVSALASRRSAAKIPEITMCSHSGKTSHTDDAGSQLSEN